MMYRTGASLAFAAVLALALFVVQGAAFGVVSIDYGTEWTKTALIKPGMPFDIVFGRDSKRKIQSTVAFKGKYPEDGDVAKMERLIGTDAYSHASRDPSTSFHAAKLLLCRDCTKGKPDSAELYHRVFGGDITNPLVSNYTGSSCLVQPRANVPNRLRPEALVGLQLDYIRELVEEVADERLSIGFSLDQYYMSAQKGLDSVITVPVYYTASERNAIFNAAVFAGFRPHLVSDSAAVAASYAQTRTFERPETHILYDAGSGAARAALVELRTERIAADSITAIKTPRDVNVVRVLDAAWERNVGGLELDIRLRDAMAHAFDTEHKEQLAGETVTKNKRAMARLLREANRMKHVLSANAAAMTNVESVMNDLDLHFSIQRSEFEEILRKDGLLDRFAAPITELLKRTGRNINSINSVLLAGGTTRVPAVQDALRAAGVPESKLAQNINADEAAVMGGALFGATFQPQLRMKPLRVEDFQPYTIQMTDPSGAVHKVFPAGPMDTIDYSLQLRDITSDTEISLDYGADSTKRLPADDNGHLYHVGLKQISAELEPVSAAGELGKMTTEMNVSLNSFPQGTVRLFPVPFAVRPRAGSVADSLRSFFGLNPNTTSNATVEKVFNVDVVMKPTSTVLPIAGEDRIGTVELLRRVTYESRQRVLREEVFNVLESGIYRARELPSDEAFNKASKEYERKGLERVVNELSAWIATDGEKASAEELTKKQKEIAAYVDPIIGRIEQSKRRDVAVAALKATIVDSTSFISAARANLTNALAAQQASKYSATELDSLAMQVEKDAQWLEEGLMKQSKRAVNEDPAILVEDVDRRSKKQRDIVRRLEKRRLPKTRPQKASSASSSPSTNSSASSSKQTSAQSTSATQSSSAQATSTEPVHDEL